MNIETLAVHAGVEIDPATGAVAPPIQLSTTFERDPDGTFPRGYIYGRSGAPTRGALERCLAALEHGADAVAFASASAATSAIFQALAPGDHVVAPHDAYYGTGKLLRETFGPWGLQTTFVDMSDLAAVARALGRPTRLVWVETPSNPLWTVTDIAAVAGLARQAGARLVCDNTTATPVLQSPFRLGADVIVHASTKYLGGHGDVFGGAVVVRERDAFAERVRALQTAGGAVPSAFDCWLVRRGIRTLPLRMRAHCASARRLAEFLIHQPRVERVHYPGLPTHPGHAVAARQMADFGGMLSFEVRGGPAEALGVAAKLRIVTRATSFGGTESLIEHRASIEGPGTRAPAALLRLSVGLEHPDDLVDDLAHALA